MDNNCNGNIDEPGCVDETPPEFAGIVTINATNNDSVLLRWNPATDDTTPMGRMAYRVYYDTADHFDPQNATLVSETIGTDTETVEGLTAGTQYFFLVVALDEAGNTDPDRIYRTVRTAPHVIKRRRDVTLVDTIEEQLTPPVPGEAEGEYVFEEDPDEPLAAGQYIVGQDSGGSSFLRRVESVRQENGKTVAATAPASMSDVIDPVYMDSAMVLESPDDIADVTEVRREARGKNGEQHAFTYREKVNSDRTYIVKEYDYSTPVDAVRDEAVVFRAGKRARAAAARKKASAVDDTGRLKIVAQNRMVRVGSDLVLPVQAYLVDENGQIDPRQEPGIRIAFEGLTHASVEDKSGQGNYGAYFDDGNNRLVWTVKKDHASKKPYTAKFRASSLFSDLSVELAVQIDVLAKGKHSSSFDTSHKCELNTEFYFEPELRTAVDTSKLGRIREGEIIASGRFGVNIDALYEFTAEAKLEKKKKLFQRTWTSIYQAGPLTVYQDITFTLDAKLTASAEAAVSAGAFSNLESFLEVGARYNPETDEWDMVKDSGFSKSVTMNLSVEGKLGAEIRLIPQIDVTFYKVATGSFFVEPYLKRALAVEWVTDADILRQILISQYQMTDMSAYLGVECFIAADLTVWKWELWKLDKKKLFSFDYPLFSLPTLSLSADGAGAAVARPVPLTAAVKNGKKNPFDEDSASWNAYPATGVITVLGRETDPDDPETTRFRATFTPEEAGEYKIYFSGNSRFGAITRQYAMTSFEAEASEPAQGPKNLTAIPGNGFVTLNWDALDGAVAYSVYGGTETGVTPSNAVIAESSVSSAYTVSGLTNGTKYYFVVAAENAEGGIKLSAEVSATPSENPAGETITDTSGLGMTLVRIPAGTFMMGSPEDEPGRYWDEKQHQVTLTRDYYMMTTEVTQAQWEAVMGENPSWFKNCGGNCPVEDVSWDDVQVFITSLNAMEGRTYRLPTEAEWEYAARAGSTTALYNGPIQILGYRNAPALDPIAWYGGNSGVSYAGAWDSSGWSEKQYNHNRAGTHPVAQKQPNAWGLYDMSGNVWEWCQDWYGDYPDGAVVDPEGADTGSSRVIRGGGWYGNARYCRSAYRNYRISRFGRSGSGRRGASAPQRSGVRDERSGERPEAFFE